MEFIAGTISKRKGRKEEEKAGKLASQSREGSSRGTRTRRRTTTNGGSLSSRGSATGMQCGLCAVVAGLFRRAMCIAGSRRGSGESCYQEITPDTQTRRHSQLAPIETGLKAAEIAEHVKEAVETQEVRLIYRPSMHTRTYIGREGNWTVLTCSCFAPRPPDVAPEFCTVLLRVLCAIKARKLEAVADIANNPYNICIWGRG